MHLKETNKIQNWSEAEKEVWKMEEAYWQNFSQGDVESLLILWHENFTGWPVNTAKPENRDDSILSLERFLENARIVSYELIPQVNVIRGKLAFLHYLVNAVVENRKGGMSQILFRVVHTWANEGKEWKLIGGMSAN